MSEKTDENGHSSKARLFKSIDGLQETVAFINYLFSKRDVREALTPEQIITCAEQMNAVQTSTNAVAVQLDALMPRRIKRFELNVAGELPNAPGENAMMRQVPADD